MLSEITFLRAQETMCDVLLHPILPLQKPLTWRKCTQAVQDSNDVKVFHSFATNFLLAVSHLVFLSTYW